MIAIASCGGYRQRNTCWLLKSSAMGVVVEYHFREPSADLRKMIFNMLVVN